MKAGSATFDLASGKTLLASPDAILAFVLEDDPTIYVREAAIDRLAKRMKAKVVGDTMIFSERGRKLNRGIDLLQPPPAEDRWTPRILIAKWIFTAGLICRRHMPGEWVQLLDKRRRPVCWYQVREESNWCVFDAEGECAISIVTVEGDFWHDGPGVGTPKREKRQLARCWR